MNASIWPDMFYLTLPVVEEVVRLKRSPRSRGDR